MISPSIQLSRPKPLKLSCCLSFTHHSHPIAQSRSCQHYLQKLSRTELLFNTSNVTVLVQTTITALLDSLVCASCSAPTLFTTEQQDFGTCCLLSAWNALIQIWDGLLLHLLSNTIFSVRPSLRATSKTALY